MARARKQKKRTITPWTPTDLRTMRRQAGRVPAGRIAKDLKRTEGALRQKAAALGISMRLR